MTIRFSPARNRNARVGAVGGTAIGLSGINAANDDGPASGDNDLLGEALLHFAVHGLGAAERARDLAADARRAGDDEACDRWLSVCRMFDRRMAKAFAARDDIASG